ncbi:uncharacterized protein K489DRAFT_129847 [Dissoconium aciculare CBS 342.82]|uniref:Secreted protein n=1 Tax=Dissoconium aciculare CBS 342.82 TaxID=1314786 RepID=A0A6J3LRC3_9PEZI|nr:uncharacterized protein K489DRAFT_129847 [Dissoconium aciculare CBS 342.82]KAF1818173.1 hypothetical protein K489DRAFT_129847 [Dissoconium aciculare CBS 342.82]
MVITVMIVYLQILMKCVQCMQAVPLYDIDKHQGNSELWPHHRQQNIGGASCLPHDARAQGSTHYTFFSDPRSITYQSSRFF